MSPYLFGSYDAGAVEAAGAGVAAGAAAGADTAGAAADLAGAATVLAGAAAVGLAVVGVADVPAGLMLPISLRILGLVASLTTKWLSPRPSEAIFKRKPNCLSVI